MNGWSTIAAIGASIAAVAIIWTIASATVQAQENGNQVKIACIDAGGSWLDYNSTCIGSEGTSE